MNYLDLSKTVSHALCYAPWEYGLELDVDGWVSIEQLISSFKNQAKWHDLTEEELVKMIELSEKKRHEIKDGKIRAFYGHSMAEKIYKEVGSPPQYLYHGTNLDNLEQFKKDGLLPMARQYVHLSENIDIASKVASRREGEVVIFSIDTQRAIDEGIVFYHGNEQIWLTDSMPFKFMTIVNQNEQS